MATYSIEPTRDNLHGRFSREWKPILTINPSDTVRFRTLDAAWGTFEQDDPFAETTAKFQPQDEELDTGHALCGPVAVRGAQPGMTLAVTVKQLRTGGWGWSGAGDYDSPWNRKLGLVGKPHWRTGWVLDPEAGTARNKYGQTVRLRPFLGVMGLPPDEPGHHATFPPRFCGGNIDCKELIEGTTLYLPVTVPNALFSTGDGHAVQGDGEVSGVAIECPMELAELEFNLLPDLTLKNPRAKTPDAWLTFGFNEDLDEALLDALEGMIDLMQEIYGYERAEALNLASLVVDLRITQIVNGVRGVHAVLRDGSVQ